jgi:Restriction Endonuclease associating with ARP
MALDGFKKQAWASLATYKRDVLGVAEDGEWRGRKYAHILPAAQRRLNILARIREPFWDWFAGRGIKLHRDFCHLNSSQALCFNLFFPFVAGGPKSLQRILDALGIRDEAVCGATFEYQPDDREGTSFDFMIPMASGARVYFELKYTESQFGKVAADAEHSAKFERVYRPRLAERFTEPLCREAGFLAHYQIARNIWHLNGQSGDIAVFLYPKSNLAVRQSEPVIHGCAIEPFRSRVRVIFLEDMLGLLRRDSRCSALERSALAEFEGKYFPRENGGLSSGTFRDARLAG